VDLYPGAVGFLRRAAKLADVVIVTAGLARVWERLLERYGLGDEVSLLAGIRTVDPFVLGRREKGQIALHFKGLGKAIVAWATPMWTA